MRKGLAWFTGSLLVTLSCLVGLLWLSNRSYRQAFAEDTTYEIGYGIRQFFETYHRFPLHFASGKSKQQRGGWLKTNERLVRILVGLDGSENPQNIAFNDWEEVSGSAWSKFGIRGGILTSERINDIPIGPLVDPWGKCYRIRIDNEQKGWLTNPSDYPKGNRYLPNRKRLNTSMVVISAGPDGRFQTWDDNLVSIRDVCFEQE